jgi:hypothetical protein
MGIFGWSYPPGCSGTPFDEASGPCDVCGLDPESPPDRGGCICPECPVCGSTGDPSCYPAHGLRRTAEQEASFAAFCAAQDEQASIDTFLDIDQENL